VLGRRDSDGGDAVADGDLLFGDMGLEEGIVEQ
jgi:hypothetical protein